MPDKENLEMITTIGNVAAGVAKYGAPVIMTIVNQLQNNNDPSEEDIKGLTLLMKPARDYFAPKDPPEDSSEDSS